MPARAQNNTVQGAARGGDDGASFFSKITRQRIRRGVLRSIVDLQAAINAYLAEHNANPKPFVWTKSADAILAKLDRIPVSSECV
jgi:hypothetical protein